MDTSLKPVKTKTQNKTVIRSMDILNLFVQHERLSSSDIVKLSGYAKTTVHRMMSSLEDMGFLTKGHDGKYELGLLFLQFGNLVAKRLNIRTLALPIMQKLLAEVGEAVHLVLRDGDYALYVEKLDTNHPVRLYTNIGKRAPLYAGASSRIILAFLTEQEQDDYFNRTSLLPISSNTYTDINKLKLALTQSVQQGYSFSQSELEDYTAELSAPIFDHTGQIVAALSVAGLEVRFNEANLPSLITTVKAAAHEISLMLGAR